MNVVNTTDNSSEYLEDKTEVLEPFVDMSSIVPVAPPVAMAPEIVEVLTEPPVEELTPSTEVVAEAPVVEVPAVQNHFPAFPS